MPCSRLGWKFGFAKLECLGLGNSKGDPSTPQNWNPIFGMPPCPWKGEFWAHLCLTLQQRTVAKGRELWCPPKAPGSLRCINSGLACRQKHDVLSDCTFWLAGTKLRSLSLLIKPRRSNTFPAKYPASIYTFPLKKESCDIFWIPKRGVKTSKLDGMSSHAQYKSNFSCLSVSLIILIT